MFNFSDKRYFIFVINKVRIILRLVIRLPKYVVILNVKLTLFLSWLIIFKRIVFADNLLAKDNFEVLGREDAES